jgi:hypothetical protein
VDAEDEAEEEGGQDSDEEFLSLPQEQRRPAVWELYTRPSQAALEELEAANASKTSLGSVGNKDLTTTTTTTAIAPLAPTTFKWGEIRTFAGLSRILTQWESEYHESCVRKWEWEGELDI